ncbi:FMN-binding protein [Carboxylicivirga marina]|uniref:4Fe-4S binding protein n=1 Tax=Carboxylicivirga marina TaxID=2800988 RepID=A0ABS1HI41_9BACT|nr:4Fe-4S binding protein [Carboxylicivirga marina]MBK3517341.1 4Fe-4S binding protein [Carboxylicivirga marina]
MTHTLKTNSIYNYLVIILLLLAVAIRGGANFDWLKSSDQLVYSLEDMKAIYKDANSIKKQADNSLAVFDANNKLLGYALVSEELDARYSGYAGPIPVLIALNIDKEVISTTLLKNDETGEFLDHVNDTKLLSTWDNMPMDTLLLSVEVDAVSGATKSSKAIIRTVHYTIGNYLDAKHQHAGISLLRIIQLLLMAILLFLSLSMQIGKRFKKFYVYYLVTLFLVMGLWLKKMLSIELFNNWLTKGLPWQSNWELIAILIISLALTILGHKKYYCTYMCPMGALQMLVSKVSPFKKRPFKLKISVLSLQDIYLSFIWVSLILGFTLPLANMEPFLAFSYKVASWIMLGVGGIIILLSLFFNRPWCQLCPTGCLLDSMPSFKNVNNYRHAK